MKIPEQVLVDRITCIKHLITYEHGNYLSLLCV